MNLSVMNITTIFHAMKNVSFELFTLPLMLNHFMAQWLYGLYAV